MICRLTSVITLEPTREGRSSGRRIGDQVVSGLCPDTPQDELVMWELVGHWLRDIPPVLHEGVVIARHGLGCMAKSIRNDIDEVLDFVAIGSRAGGCDCCGGQQRRGEEGGGAEVHFEKMGEDWWE